MFVSHYCFSYSGRALRLMEVLRVPPVLFLESLMRVFPI